MTRNIVDVIQEQAMNQPTPTEKSQLLVTFASNAQIMFRFNSVKKGEKERDKLIKAWDMSKARGGIGQGPALHHVSADMFSGDVDLTKVLYVCFVDHAKHAKFIPIP